MARPRVTDTIDRLAEMDLWQIRKLVAAAIEASAHKAEAAFGAPEALVFLQQVTDRAIEVERTIDTGAAARNREAAKADRYFQMTGERS